MARPVGVVPAGVVAPAAVSPPKELRVYAEMLLAPLFATNKASIVGVMAMAEGTAPVPTLLPFALSWPFARFTTKAEMVVLDCAVTKRRPAPPLFTAELFPPQAIKQRSTTGKSTCCRKRNFIPILSPSSIQDLTDADRKASRHTLGDQGLSHSCIKEYTGSANFSP